MLTEVPRCRYESVGGLVAVDALHEIYFRLKESEKARTLIRLTLMRVGIASASKSVWR